MLSGQVKRVDRLSNADGRGRSASASSASRKSTSSPSSSPITKYAVTVDDPQSIRYHLEKALYLASSGRPGPVWIDIPLDVQASPIDPDALPGFDIPAADGDPVTLERDVKEVLERLKNAERPMLVAGNGIRMARAEREFRELVTVLDIPIETTWLAIDFIEHEHPRFVGRPGTIAARGANFAIQACDFMLAIGARMDRIITGYSPATFAKNAYKVMVDVDPSELAKMGDAVHRTVNADAGAFLREMLRQAPALEPRPDRSAWQKRCAEWKTRYPVVLPEHRTPDGPVSVYHLSEVLADALPDGAQIVSGSSGSGIELFLLAFDVKRAQRIFHTSGLGAMGTASPRRLARVSVPDASPSCASMATAGSSSTSRSSKRWRG